MMIATKKSITLSNILLRNFFLLFLSQSLLYDTNTGVSPVVDAAYFDFQQTHVIDSCKDYGVTAGKTLDEDCTAYCGPDPMESFDYADVEEDANYVIRNTVCRCSEYGQSEASPTRKTKECWTKAEVWDKKKPLMKCKDDYEIVSLTTCQDYCKKIDPVAYRFKGFSGSSECECGGVLVCSDVPPASAASTTIATSISTALTLVIGWTFVIWS